MFQHPRTLFGVRGTAETSLIGACGQMTGWVRWFSVINVDRWWWAACPASEVCWNLHSSGKWTALTFLLWFPRLQTPVLLLCTHVEVECVAVLSECVVLTSGSTLADEELTRACVHEAEYACTAVYSEHFLYNLRLQRQVFYSSQERSTKLKAPILFSFSVFILEQLRMPNLSWLILVCS